MISCMSDGSQRQFFQRTKIYDSNINKACLFMWEPIKAISVAPAINFEGFLVFGFGRFWSVLAVFG